MSNDAIYNSDNRESYQHGAEIIIFFQKDTEVSWASVGRFSIEALKDERVLKLFDSGSKFDDDILLPVNLIGIMKSPEVMAGSITTKKLQHIDVKSTFRDFESIWQCIITEF